MKALGTRLRLLSSGSEMPLNFQGEYIKAFLENFLKTI
jgi:hypothetical protein